MKRKEQHPYYPMFLKISGKRCVVIGGGEVALRKVKMLIEHEANVEVITPEACSQLNQLAERGEIRMFPRRFQAGDLKDAFIIIAATDDSDANRKVAREARKKAVLVNVVDEPENCDFIVPSYLRRGDITIAISTGGRSPALARKIRARLEKDFENEFAALAVLVDEARDEVKRKGIKVNGDAWQEALDLDLLIDMLRKGNGEQARTILLNNLKTQQR